MGNKQEEQNSHLPWDNYLTMAVMLSFLVTLHFFIAKLIV